MHHQGCLGLGPGLCNTIKSTAENYW